VGYDTFENGPEGAYPLPGEFDTEAEAQEGARQRLAELEIRQPGGQGVWSLQDHVYVARPDGTSYRFFKSEEAMRAYFEALEGLGANVKNQPKPQE
jgi:hypothetical protein